MMLSCDYEKKYQDQPLSYHAEDGIAEREKPWDSGRTIPKSFLP